MVQCHFETPDELHSRHEPSFQREALCLPILLKIPTSLCCSRDFHSPQILNPLLQMHPRLLVVFSVLRVFVLLSQMVGQGTLLIH